jgi:hypothetical protein
LPLYNRQEFCGISCFKNQLTPLKNREVKFGEKWSMRPSYLLASSAVWAVPSVVPLPAHAVHNGLTHIPAAHDALHGEKVAYGILVQLRLEEMLQGNQLAASARQQLLKFYAEIGLPQTLDDLNLGNITLSELRKAAEIACNPKSDIHRLPFNVVPEQLMAAMVSTTTPVERSRSHQELTAAMNEE